MPLSTIFQTPKSVVLGLWSESTTLTTEPPRPRP